MSALKDTVNKTIVPESTTKKGILVHRNKIFFLFVGVALVGFGILTTLVKMNPPYFPLDLRITRFVQSFNPMWFDGLMQFISYLGNLVPGSVMTIGMAAILFFYKKNRESIFLILSVLGVTGIGLLFKRFVSRVRPDKELINQVNEFLRNDSFPSGHVLFYIGFFGFLLFLCFLLVKKSRIKYIYITILCTLLLLIGLSRIYLGAHWFSDVLGAYLLGIVWLGVMAFVYRKFALKRNAAFQGSK